MILILDLALVDMTHCKKLNGFSKVHAHGLWPHLSISVAYDRTSPFPWPSVHGVSTNG